MNLHKALSAISATRVRSSSGERVILHLVGMSLVIVPFASLTLSFRFLAVTGLVANGFFAVFLVVYPGEGNLWSLKIMLI